MITDTLPRADQTLHLPRILCLHGGGTNARIFHSQCRSIRRCLSTTFRLVFAEAPFSSEAGPDVTLVYKDYGPFKRWLRSSEAHPYIDPVTAVEAIKRSLQKAMDEDNRLGGHGEWVGLLGFSQGAKMCASLLYHHQVLSERLGIHNSKPNWQFAILLAGRGPLVSLDPNPLTSRTLVDASQIAMTPLADENFDNRIGRMLYLPTIHIHGTLDPHLHEHRKLLAQYCDKGTVKVMEWEGAHRVPIKTKDVLNLVQHIWDIAYETGVMQMPMSAALLGAEL